MRDHPFAVQARIDSIVESAPAMDVLLAQYRANVAHYSLDRLGNIRTPTLVTVGSFDVAVPPIYSREAADAIPGAEFVVFKDGGHLHNTEQPDEFNAVTLDFLQRHAA